MEAHEIVRRLNNIASVGTISEIKAGQALARVKILDRVTAFLPVVSQSNSFKKHFIPLKLNEQVLVFSPFGDASSGFILRGIFNKSCKEPNNSSQTCEVTQYEDGTVITYDTAAKELKINAVGNVTVICKTANIKADQVIVDSGSIDLGKGGKGVVTGDCTCALTGLPHHDFSSNTRSKK